MKRIHGLLVLLLAGLWLIAAGCTDTGSNMNSGPSGRVEATWVSVSVAGDTVSIPQNTIDTFTNVHFNIPTAHGQLAVMAYNLDTQTYVRANVCPPCQSIGFTLSDDMLICDSCETSFDATTGNGISGGCIAYPKEEVTHIVEGGKVMMNINDLITAYAATMQKG